MTDRKLLCLWAAPPYPGLPTALDEGMYLECTLNCDKSQEPYVLTFFEVC